MDTALIIPAAGSGTRLGTAEPKAFIELGGRTLLAWAVLSGVRAGCGEVVIAAPEHLLEQAQTIADEIGGARMTVIAGGEHRGASVAAGVRALTQRAPRFVLVHDAARALTPDAVFARVLAALTAGARNVVPTLPVADTMRAVCPDAQPAGLPAGSEVLAAAVDRSALRRVQTPQGFRYADLAEAHRRAESAGWTATDDAGLVERMGIPVTGVPGDEAAHKITYPDDLRTARTRVQEG